MLSASSRMNAPDRNFLGLCLIIKHFYCPFLSEARLALKKYIAKVSATVTDTEKGPGKLYKEDKVQHCAYILF